MRFFFRRNARIISVSQTEVIDTDALLGLFFERDAHAAAAYRIMQQLAERNTTIIIPPTTLSEFALLASSKIGVQKTQEAVERLASKHFRTFTVTPQVTHEAVALYQKQTSKEESLFDCFVMVTAQHETADCIFSFDKGYTKNGFVLIEDFFRQHEKE